MVTDLTKSLIGGCIRSAWLSTKKIQELFGKTCQFMSLHGYMMISGATSISGGILVQPNLSWPSIHILKAMSAQKFAISPF
jgi:hypothetical protein